MATRLAHRAKLMAMDLTIMAMQHTRSSEVLSALVRRVYSLVSNEQIVLTGGMILSAAIAGLIIGYLAYFWL